MLLLASVNSVNSVNSVKKKWVWHCAEVASRWGFPFNISATAEDSDLKFGTQLRFVKAHHKITPRGISKGDLGLAGSQNFGVPL